MRVGLRVGPVWVSSGGSRRRKSGPSSLKMLFVFACLVATGDALVSGGWWAVLGWTIVGVTVLVMLGRLFRKTPGSQHHAGSKTQTPGDAGRGPDPVSERMYHSDRR